MSAERAPVTRILLFILLPAAALLLEGCICMLDTMTEACGSTFKDKNGREVSVSTLWPCGYKPARDYLDFECPSTKFPPEEDGHVRQEQQYEYEGDHNELECPGVGSQFLKDGVEAEGITLGGECKEIIVNYTTPLCGEQSTRDHCSVHGLEFNESMNNVPLDPFVDSQIVGMTNCCVNRFGLFTTPPNANPLYVAIGIFQPGVAMDTGAVGAAGIVMAAVIGVVVRRLRASSATASTSVQLYSGESDIE